MTKLNKKTLDSIRNHSNEIESLDIVQGIRENVGMYLESKEKALPNMIREVFQNSIDEIQRADSPSKFVSITFNEKDLSTLIEDGGRGIPYGKIIDCFTKLHTGSNFNKIGKIKDNSNIAGNYSSGKHGSGLKATNALSKKLIVESYILGEGRRVEFNEGYAWDKGEAIISNDKNRQGTSVYFIPSIEVLGYISLTVEEVLLMVQEITMLTKIGTTVIFKGIYKDGHVYEETIHNNEGILKGLVYKTTSPLIKPIHFMDDNGITKAEIMFTYDSQDINSAEDISSYSNMCKTDLGGSHLDGFLDGLCRFFRNYMNKIYLVSSNKKKKNPLVTNAADIKTGLKGIISAAHITAVFTGQSKNKLSNPDMQEFVKELTLKSLDEWSKSNPKDLEKLCKYFKEVGEIRTKSEEGKVKLSDKYKTSSLSNGLPVKYKKPNGTKHLELIIVEGDSAGGSAKMCRDKDTQGIYPIRGKLPNAMTTQLRDLLHNEEVAGLIALLGGTYGRNFDIDKCPFEYIIFSADADPDGDHISTLLLKIFLILFPQLIIEGRVYKAMPPLYGIKQGKKMKYFNDNYDYILYTQNIFNKDNVVENTNNKKYTTKELSTVLYQNADYVYYLETLSNKFALNPELVELYLINRNQSLSKIKDIISNRFRFVNKLEKINDTIFIEGLIGNKYQTFIINDKFIHEASDVLHNIENTENMYYIINGEIVSLYGLMKKFESYTPKNLTRYKGLGEMNPDQLGESTLNKETRNLVRYTIDSAKEEIEMIRYMESNKAELLKGLEVTRRDLE